MNETSMSMRSALAISFFSSENICGSCTAPVNRLLWAMEVSGRTASRAVLPSASAGSCSAKRAISCSARSSMPWPSVSGISPISRFASAT